MLLYNYYYYNYYKRKRKKGEREGGYDEEVVRSKKYLRGVKNKTKKKKKRKRTRLEKNVVVLVIDILAKDARRSWCVRADKDRNVPWFGLQRDRHAEFGGP